MVGGVDLSLAAVMGPACWMRMSGRSWPGCAAKPPSWRWNVMPQAQLRPLGQGRDGTVAVAVVIASQRETHCIPHTVGFLAARVDDQSFRALQLLTGTSHGDGKVAALARWPLGQSQRPIAPGRRRCGVMRAPPRL
jgi:hypothetical protein